MKTLGWDSHSAPVNGQIVRAPQIIASMCRRHYLVKKDNAITKCPVKGYRLG